ncbi:hypothetical protein [Listeria rustica]|uniref:Right handed beta helix domain-containing protein n=1 Tax=Listeria rustica TaxID=2713503 RepID=A0A7W1YHM8_9LIST|nr:hypothetical protein [Listeria rustica]MBA3927856.1 hypothetical protein [Listeria rustica]
MVNRLKESLVTMEERASEDTVIKYYTNGKLESKVYIIPALSTPKEVSSYIAGSLNIAVKNKFTCVQLPAGKYELDNTVHVPGGMTLEGTRDENGNNLTTLTVPMMNDAGTVHRLNKLALVTADSGIDSSNTTIRRIILDGRWDAESNILIDGHRGIFLSPFPQSKKRGDGYYKDAERKHDITIEDMTIRNFGGSGIYMDFVNNVNIGELGSEQNEKSNRIENIGYGGVIGYSIDNVCVSNTWISDIGLAGKQAYGIAVSWQKGTTDENQLANNDRSRFADTAEGESLWKETPYVNGYYPSRNVKIVNNIIMNNASWEALDTHSGKNISFIGNRIMGVRFPIVLGGMEYDGGAISAYPPEDIDISENVINNKEDIKKYNPKPIPSERGIAANGAQFNDLLKESIGFLKGLTIKKNEVNNIQAVKNTQGGIGIHVTFRACIIGNHINNTKFNGLALLSSNKKTVLQNNTITSIQEAKANEMSVCIGIRGSHNNGNTSNTYSSEPLTSEGTSIMNNKLDVGGQNKNIAEIYQNPASISNMLNFI